MIKIFSSLKKKVIILLDIFICIFIFLFIYMILFGSVKIHIGEVRLVFFPRFIQPLILCCMCILLRTFYGFTPYPFFYKYRKYPKLQNYILNNGEKAIIILITVFLIYHVLKIVILYIFIKAAFITIDLSIFHEGLLSLSKGGFYNNSIQHIQLAGLKHYATESNSIISGFTFHQNFIMYLLVPFYLFFPNPLFLQLTSVIILTINTWLIYCTVKNIVQNNETAFYCSCVFLIIPSSIMIPLGFFPDCFAVLFLIVFFYFITKKKEWLAIIPLCLLLLVRENYCIIAISLGIYFFFYQKKKRFGSIIFFIGILHFFVGTIILPHVFSKGINISAMRALQIFNQFGSTLPEVFINMIKNPIRTLLLLFRLESIIYFCLLTGPFIVVSLKNPLYLTIIPILLINSLSGASWAIKIDLHHSWPIIPIIFIAWIQGINKYNENKIKQITLTAILCLFSIFLTSSAFNSHFSIVELFSKHRHSNQRNLITYINSSNNLNKILTKIPVNASITIDIRCPVEYLFCLTSKRKTTIFPRNIKHVEYFISFEFINDMVTEEKKGKRLKKPEWEDITDFYYQEYFNSNKQKLWKEIAYYYRSRKEKISLWERIDKFNIE